MKTIAIVNHKGGVAKTTTASNVASLLSNYKRVLAIDLDAQCNLTKSFIIEPYEQSVFDLFLGRQCNPIINVKKNFDILPASIDLSGLDTMLGAKLEKERILADILKEIESRNLYDLVIIDCPPSLQLATINALVAASDMIVPVMPEFHAVSGLMDIENIYNIVKRRLNPELNFAGLVITRFNSTKGMHTTVEKSLRASYQSKVFDTVIRDNIKLAECPTFQKDIFTYAPKSNGAADYTTFTEEIIKRISNRQTPSTVH